jgi:OFA family oxalate/formate antiporter-like MFS transporter
MRSVRPIFYGWVVVIGAWLAMLVSSASLSSFSIFAPELEAQFQWSRVMSSWGYTINTVTISIFGVVGGMMADRIGIRRLVLTGAVIGGIGMALLSQTSQLWHFYLLFGVIAPAGIAFCFIVPTVATVRRWFMRKASLAIGIAMTGSGLGVVVLIPLYQRLLESIGWSHTYIVLGVILLLGGIGGGMLLKKDPESAGMHPDGISPAAGEMESRADFAARNQIWPLKEVFKTAAWWLLVLAQFFHIAIVGLVGHLVFWGNEDLGIAKGTVVGTLSLFALAAVVGRLAAGFLSDWYMSRFGSSRKPALYVCTISVALGCLLSMWVSTQTELLLVCLLIGFGYGIGLAVFPAYLGDMYGVVSVPTLFGIMFLCTAGLFGGIGPVLFGFLHDAYGSYDMAFLTTAILCFISAITLFMIKPPVKRKTVT